MEVIAPQIEGKEAPLAAIISMSFLLSWKGYSKLGGSRSPTGGLAPSTKALCICKLGRTQRLPKMPRFFCDSRAFRFASVKWWQNNLSPEVERADAEGMALSIVEDDRLVKGLQDLAAKACSEEGFKDCLDQGFKCETDRWEGHVIWFGPKAVEYFLGALQQDHPSVDLRWLEGQRELPAECAAHFVPFSHKTSRRACFSN